MTLEVAWKEIKKLLSQGVSLIPVRDKDEFAGGRTYAAKTPFYDWKEYQNKVVSEEYLWHAMEKYKTTAVAILAGEISGNLEVIDIDEKYKPGISMLVIQDVRVLMPELYSKLRIHKTVNSGYHFFYKVKDFKVPKEGSLAARPTTQEEQEEFLIEHSSKRPPKVKKFIETRGEGQYALAPPSLGYEIINDVEIPTISIEERESLINICRNYNEVFKQPKVYETERNKVDYYDENPYNHYSRTAEPVAFLDSIGWKFVNQRGVYLWFTRPGKTSGVSGSFNMETRIFWSFSTSTDLEESKGYFLASMLIDYKFNGDKKAAYTWLVDNGYGKINRKYEQIQVKRKAISDEDLPANFSEEAQQGYDELVKDLKEKHPHGIFWEVGDEDIIINREKLYAISANIGYRNFEDEIHKIESGLLHKRTLRDYFDDMKSYIKIDDVELHEDVLNAYEAFIEKHGKFTSERLKILSEDELIQDNKHTAYKFYKDKWVIVNKDDIKIMDYTDLNKVVSASKVQQRNLMLGEGGKYIEFLNKSCELMQNTEYIQKIIGYYAHDYNDETMGFMVILTEQCEDPKHGGRSGKNLFVMLLQNTISLVDRAGSEISFNDNKIFQSWNGERVFSISDLPKDFDLSYFKNISTGGFTQWKLHKDLKHIPITKSFKLIFSTNFSFNCSDGGLAARVVALEFTDFFKRMNGVDTYFGAHFPKDWNQEDWAGFDNFILNSLQTWFRCSGKLKSKELSLTGWKKQFEMKWGVTVMGILEMYWARFVQLEFVSTDKFNQILNDYYQENMTPPSYRVSSTKINKAIEEYAVHMNILFEKDHNLAGMKGRLFKHIETPF